MTYNIHRWAGTDRRLDVARLAEVIRSADADLVGLNEVLHPVTRGGHTFFPLADLAKRLGMTYAFGASGWTDYGPGWYGPVGNALLSRYPLSGISNGLLPRIPGTKQRSLLGACVAAGHAQGLAAYVTHLDHAFEFTRLYQIRDVIRRMSHNGPHYLGGDFNTPGFVGAHMRRLLPPVLRMMQTAGYRDAFDAVGRGRGHTFPARSPLVRIDFLFFPHRWARGLRSARVLDWDETIGASDHSPVVAEWGWPEPALG